MFSSPKQLCKRLLSVLLALTFVASPIAVIAEDAAQAFAAKNTEPTALVFATSDFQPRDLSKDISTHASFSISAGVGQMQSIIDKIDDDYDLTSFTGALHCGDFSNYSKYNGKWYSYAYGNNPVITQDGVSAVEYVLGKNFHLTPEEMVFIQGNHDFYIDPIDYTGAHDTEQYGVYAINEKDFMYQQATVANCEDTVKKTAADLDAYLQAKIDQHYNKPIFIVNHVPLHHNPRSVDNLHSKYLFDVVNAAGAKGLTIIFLFGHNHGSGYDAHIGEGSIYLAPGDTIYIPDGTYNAPTNDPTKGVAGKQKKTLNFVYMNPGYTGYISTKEGGVDTTLTSTVFAIYEDKVEIRRYDSTGLHNLKAKGKLLTAYSTTTDHSLYTDTKVYASPQTISLTDGKFNVSLDTDALYPNKTINSKYLNSATFAADNPTSANSLVSNKTYVNKNVTVPDAAGFNVGDKGKIGINCATEEFVIKEVISSNTSVAQVVKDGDNVVYDDAGRFEVEGIGVGTTTITVIAEAVNGEYDDVIITYDLTVFPESSELKPLFYTKYRLTDATKQANHNISDTHITSESATEPNITVGKTYVLVTDYKNAVVKNSNGTEAGGWSYALIGTSSSTTTSRNVAVYGTPTVVTADTIWKGGTNGSFIESCDPLMEWTYVGGNRMRNNATGEYLYADGATLKTTGTATADEMYYRFLEGGYGFFLRTSSDTNTHDRRYFRATAATTNTLSGKAIVPINVETVNNSTNGDKRYSNNVFIYEKITDSEETGAYAWVEGIVDNKITAFTGDVNGATSATLCITDGVNVTRTPLTLNMIHSTSTAVQASTAAGTVGTNFSIVYDGVTLESGLTLNLVDEPEIKFYNRTAKIGGDYNHFAEVTSGENVKLIFSYEVENTKYVTLKEDGTLTGKEVGGSNVTVSIDIEYPDGTVIHYPNTHVSYATTAPKDTCFTQLRTYSQSRDVYVYTESPSNSNTYSKPLLIVSDNTVGDAYVLIGSKSNYNNLNAEKITIESFNGKKFIYTPKTDYNKEWYHINNDGNTDTANGFYGLRTVSEPNKMKYALNAVQSWKNSAYTTGDMTGETGLIAVDGSRWASQVVVQYPEGTHTLQGNAGVTGWKYDHANGGFYTGHDSRPRYLLTFRDDIRQFVAVYHGTGTMANTIGKADKTNRVYTFEKKKMETPGIMIWLSDSHGTVSYGADGATYTGTMVNVTTHSPDGVETKSYPLTVDMLANITNKNLGFTTNVSTETTYSNLQVDFTYNNIESVVCSKYSLSVVPAVENDYPDYPEQGSVNVVKTSDTSKNDYFATGTAHIDLTVSGVPLSNGTDIVITLDFSTSMSAEIPEAGMSRIELLGTLLVEFLEKIRTPDENGKVPDVDIAITSFNGQSLIDQSYILSPMIPNNANYAIRHQYYNEMDNSLINLPFVDVNDSSVDTLMTKINADLTKMKKATTSSELQQDENYQVLKLQRGTNYDRGMEMTYDLLVEKKHQNEARGENRKQTVLFMSDGCTFQYNYFGTTWASDGGIENYTDNKKENGKVKWAYVLGGTLDNVTGTFSNTNTAWHKTFTSTHASAINGKDPYGIVDDTVWDVFNEYYNRDGKHWITEAVKGNEDTLYKIIDPESDNANHIDWVYGLGATVYTVGLGLESDKGVTLDVLESVLAKMASVGDKLGANGEITHSVPLFYSSNDEDSNEIIALSNAFSAITNEVITSGDAVFVDQMGDDFDLQTNTTYEVDGENYTLTTPPAITLTSYPLYKYWEVGTVVNGVTVTEDMVGKRKSDVGTVIEKITFEGTGSNTKAYSNLIDNSKTNILTNGIIQGKNVWYNTYTTSVTLNGKTYEPETFYWNVGEVPEDEYVLGYDIYLSGSMEGTALGGIHDTNEYARLDYVNHLGRNCQKSVETPTLPWDEAYIGVNFYFVNEDGKPLVNRTTGQTGSFDMAQTLGMDKTQYIKFKLNDKESVAASASADQYVPVGYKLYDESAAYSVFASSSPKIDQNWTIIKGTDVAVSSTYVTQFSSSVKSSNALTETNSDYSYTNTIVYFAIVASVDCVPDAVVIDYGLPVDIDVLENDILFTNNATLDSVGAWTDALANLEDTLDDRGTIQEGFGATYEGTYGNAEKETVDNVDVVRYKLSSMKFDGIEEFAYAANYKGDLGVNGYYYGNVTVIPATSIYYEDSDTDYVTFKAFDYATTEEITDGSRGWTPVGTTSDDSQNDDRIGDVAANVYGSDEAYDNCTRYSYGSAHKITVSRPDGDKAGTYGKIEFSFEGTGFDIISLTSNTTGTIVVQVFNASTGKQVRSSIVDTYYGYKFEDGKWSEDSTAADTLYQVPVIKMTGLGYGEYNVTVSVSYAPIFAHNGDKEYDFYLDAIRIYDPAKEDTTVQQSYAKDFEAFPKYDEIRNLLIAAKDFNSTVSDSDVTGAIFIDGISSLTDSTASGIKLNKLLPLEFGWSVPELLYPDLEDASNHVSDYAHYGPNNELYLDANQAVAFDFTAPVELQKVHLAVKALKGDTTAGTLEVYGYDANNKMTDRVVISTKSATDTYTDITKIISMDEDVASKTTIVIKNTGSSLISITNLKTTYSSEDSTISTTTVNQATASRAFEVLQMIETPEIYTMHTSKKVAEAGESVNVVLTTSANADYVTVNGVKVTAYTENSAGSRIWSVDVVASGDANMVIEALAYNVTGAASEAVSADVRIKAAENVEIVTVLGAYIDEAISGK